MKLSYFFTLGLIAVAALMIWWFMKLKAPVSENRLGQSATTQTNSTESQGTVPYLPPGIPQPKGVFHSNVEYQNAVWAILFATPIKFYGRVVDDTNSPIVGASIVAKPAQSLLGGGGETSDPTLKALSDDDGNFSFSTHGLGLSVTVSKQGYYHSKSQDMFGYAKVAGDYSPHADPTNPAIFVMRKLGKTANLVRIRHDIDFPTDGSSIEVSIRGIRTKSGQGDLQVQGWVQYAGHPPHLHDPFDWKATVTIPGGGFILNSNDPYNFTAPEDGYSDQIEVEMPSSLGKDWQSNQVNSYFLRTKDNHFARVVLAFTADRSPYITIDGYLNPTPGDRNLEFDPDNPPKEP